MSSSLPTRLLSVWVDNVSCEGKRLTTDPVKPSVSVLNGGLRGCMIHLCTDEHVHRDCVLPVEMSGVRIDGGNVLRLRENSVTAIFPGFI